MEKINIKNKTILLIALSLCIICFMSIAINLWGQKQAPINNLGTARAQAETLTVPSEENETSQIDISGTLYDITFLARLGKNTLPTEAGFKIETSGSTILSASQTGVEGYRFSHFEIYKGGDYYVLGDNFIVDISYLNPQSQIEVVGVYISVCELTVSIPRDYETMGSFAVYLKDTSTQSLTRMYPNSLGTFTFDTGTTLILEAIPARFHSFKEFGQNYKSELDEEDPLKLEIQMQINREITLYFEKITYIIEETIAPASKDFITLSTNQIKLGDDVFVSVALNSFYKIKNLKINGLSLGSSTLSGDARLSGNIASIKISEDWLQGYGNVLDIELTTELNETFLIVIICVSVVIPFFLLLLITLLLIGRRQRKILHQTMQTKRTREQITNTGDFIRGLQEGSIGSISDKTLQDKIDNMKQYEE